jgi:LacI family transcriptional regulator
MIYSKPYCKQKVWILLKKDLAFSFSICYIYAHECIQNIRGYNLKISYFMRVSAKRADVAKKAGVSESTVSRALSASPLIPNSTKEKVRRAAEALGYIPNYQASLLARQKTLRLGFVIPVYRSFPTFARSYFASLLNGVVSGAEERGYSITIIVDREGEKFKDLPVIVKRREVDGLLMSTMTINDPRIETLKKEKVPFVLINHYCRGCSSVDNDPAEGMRSALEYLKDMGHSRVGFIAGDMQYQNGIDRLNAFKEFAQQCDMETRVLSGDFSKTSGYYGAGKLLNGKERVTAIMNSSDRQAFGVLDYCRDHNIDVPDGLSVIGYDNLFTAQYIHPLLSTIDNPVMDTGHVSAILLIDMIERKIRGIKGVKLKTGFIIKDSTGKCMAQNR